jgi:hypothetical protein
VYVEEPGHVSAARRYLRGMYTNRNGVLVCQICAEAMPFKVKDDYYFVAAQFFTDARRDVQENRLALCPTCAAKFRFAKETSAEALRDDLLAQEVGTRAVTRVKVMLAGEAHEIRFVGKHAIDLQAALGAIHDAESATDNVAR